MFFYWEVNRFCFKEFKLYKVIEGILGCGENGFMLIEFKIRDIKYLFDIYKFFFYFRII